jgi:hypothetical protein
MFAVMATCPDSQNCVVSAVTLPSAPIGLTQSLVHSLHAFRLMSHESAGIAPYRGYSRMSGQSETAVRKLISPAILQQSGPYQSAVMLNALQSCSEVCFETQTNKALMRKATENTRLEPIHKLHEYKPGFQTPEQRHS